MTSLFDKLSKISQQIQEQRHLMKNNEDATILVSIQPFVHALGYNTQNLAEFFPQYNADAKTTGSEKVDFAILQDGKPIIFIEAKAANISLNESNWKQLYSYFNAEDVQFGILTNGIEYRFYTDLKKRNVMDKQPFLTVDMLKLDEQLVKELEPFTQAGFDAKSIIANAKIQRIVHLLQQEMEHPSDGIVKHLAALVYSGKVNARIIQEYTPLVRVAFSRFVEQSFGSQHYRFNLPGPIDMHLSLRHEAGIVEDVAAPIAHETVQIPVYAHYEGFNFTAQFKVKHGYKKRNDKVIFYEETWNSASGWAKELKARIHKKLNIEKTAETAGWTEFWYYKNAERKEGRIDEFRKDPALVDRYLRRTKQ